MTIELYDRPAEYSGPTNLGSRQRKDRQCMAVHGP